MESSLYSLLKVDIRNLVRNEASLLKYQRMQPSEVERLPYWQYELLIDNIIELNKEEKEEQEKQEQKQSGKYQLPKGMPSMNDVKRMTSSSTGMRIPTPKIPKL